MGPKERNLLKAAGKGDLEETARLVKDGANLSAINEDGESALTRAVSKKHIAVAKLLLDNGATTDYTGPLVHKPLHVAVQTGNTKLVQLLLDNGADVDELTARGSVLSQAITAGREDITSLLLSSDADINLARYPIQSPLGNAITRKNERLIKDLLKRGAETDVLLEHLYEVNAKQLSEIRRAGSNHPEFIFGHRRERKCPRRGSEKCVETPPARNTFNVCRIGGGVQYCKRKGICISILVTMKKVWISYLGAA
jgi:ankyrin repeat protein